jgi:uncharacterized membrane protein
MQTHVEDNRTVVNVGDTERLVSGVLGGWLIMRGLTRPSFKGLLLAGSGLALVYRATTGRSRLYRKLHISGSDRGRRNSASVPHQTGVRVEETVTIARPSEQLYEFWKNPENLPRFMSHIQSVTSLGHNRSHWVARGPMGARLEWDAETIRDQPNSLISWRSAPGSRVRNAGSVSFRPLEDGRKTEVKLSLEYRPAGGPVGAGIATFLGQNPGDQIGDDLLRLKNLMETGEVAAGT